MAEALASNQNYLVEIRRGPGGGTGITGRGGPNSVVANAQAKFNVNVNNQWVNVLQAIGMSGESNSTVSTAVNLLQIFSGANFLPQIATSHVWRGSNGIEIMLSLRFDAVNDAVQDVVEPVKRLISFWMPKRGSDAGDEMNMFRGIVPESLSSYVTNSFLQPPGPTPYEYLKGNAHERLFTIAVGRALLVKGLIPTQLQWEFEERFTREGHPVCAQVQCGFMSYVTPDANEVMDYIVSGARAGGQ